MKLRLFLCLAALAILGTLYLVVAFFSVPGESYNSQEELSRINSTYSDISGWLWNFYNEKHRPPTEGEFPKEYLERIHNDRLGGNYACYFLDGANDMQGCISFAKYSEHGFYITAETPRCTFSIY